MVFPVVMYGCESWTVKKAECRKINSFGLWCLRRPLRVPRTARRSNQSILKEILGVHWKDWCWSWNSNTLVTWCEDLTHLKRPWCWERLRAGGEGDDRGWDGWMASPTRWTWVWVDFGSWWWIGRPGVLWFMGFAKSRTRLSDWTELNWEGGVIKGLWTYGETTRVGSKIWGRGTGWGILVPQTGIQPIPHVVETQSLNHWTFREVPVIGKFFEGNIWGLCKYPVSPSSSAHEFQHLSAAPAYSDCYSDILTVILYFSIYQRLWPTVTVTLTF